MKAIPESELSGQALEDWNRIREEWTAKGMKTCMDRLSLKFSCSRCDRIFFHIRISIGPEGKIVSCSRRGMNFCGSSRESRRSRLFEKCLLDYLRDVLFPASLRNMTLDLSLGNGLKC